MLYNKDCIEVLKNIKDNSVDLVATDPPYAIGFDGGKGWDSQWKTEKEYLDWCKVWTTECVRVLKPNRMLCVFGTLKTDTFLRYKLNILNSYANMTGQEEIIWAYNWGGRKKSNFARKHEYTWCYSKGKTFLFNGDDVRVPYKMKENVRKGATNNPLGTIPTCIWEKNNHTTSKEYAGWHPTQKPIMIMERIIRAYTNIGDVVVDPFSGSGSTMIAADKCNRKFIGAEIDQEYYEKSLARRKELRVLKLLPPTSNYNTHFE